LRLIRAVTDFESACIGEGLIFCISAILSTPVISTHLLLEATSTTHLNCRIEIRFAKRRSIGPIEDAPRAVNFVLGPVEASNAEGAVDVERLQTRCRKYIRTIDNQSKRQAGKGAASLF
jgi:hypothetical protein